MKTGDKCPRCGRRIDWIEKHRRGEYWYLYAVHRTPEGRKKCYLGPKDRYVRGPYNRKELLRKLLEAKKV